MNNKIKNKHSPLMAAMISKIDSLDNNFINKESQTNHTFEVNIENIEPDPNQPRVKFDENTINELAITLKEYGQITPIIVKSKPNHYNHWLIIAGERRWRAAKIAGIKKLIVIEREEMTDVISLIENIQRENLSPVEEAKGIVAIASSYKWSQRDLAKKFGKNLSEINGLFSIAKLPNDFLEGVLNSKHSLSKNLLIELSRVTDPDIQSKLYKKALSGTLTIPNIRLYASENKKNINNKTNIKEFKKFEKFLDKNIIPQISLEESEILLSINKKINKLLQ